MKAKLESEAKLVLNQRLEVDQVLVCSGNLGEALPRPEGLTYILQHPDVREPFIVVRGRDD